MIIKQVRIRNVRNHRDTTVSFGRGTNVIVGETGSGKSTIRYAIEFGLFGECGGVSRDALITVGETEAEIELLIECSGAEYRIRRTIAREGDRTKSSAEIRDAGGVLLETGVKKTNEAIAELIGHDAEFFRIVNPPQGEVRSLLKMFPSERTKWIDAILGLGRFRVAYEAMRDVLSPLKSRIDELTGEIGAIERVIAGADVAAEMARARAEYERMLEELGVIESQLKSLESRRAVDEILNLQRKEASLKQQEAFLKQQIEECKREREDILCKIRSVEEEIRKKTADVEKMGGMAEGISESIRGLQSQIEELERRAASLNEMKGALTAQLAELEQNRSCPVCLKPVSPAELSRIACTTGEKIREMERSVAEIGRLLEECYRKKAVLEEDATRLEKEIKCLHSTLGALEGTLCEKKRTAAELDSKISGLEARLSELRREISATAEAISAAGGPEVIEEYTAKRTRYGELSRDIEHAKERLRLLEERLALVESLAKKKSVLEGLRAAHEELSTVRDLLMEVVPVVRRWYTGVLTAEMERMLSVVGPALRATGIFVTEDYMPVVIRDGFRYPATDLSGGESLLVSILLRLAIAKLITRRVAGTEVEMMILDEPVEMGLSEGAVLSLVELLNTIRLPQLIIITYNHEIKRAADRVYEVTSDGGVARVSCV